MFRYILIFSCIPLNLAAQDTENEARWDDKLFGLSVEKPERGRYWIVSDSDRGFAASVLRPGDVIMSIDGKAVTVEDDIIQLLRDGPDTVEIRAKRYTKTPSGRRKSTWDSKSFTKMTRWDAYRINFKTEPDPIKDWTTYIPTITRGVQGKTHFAPELIIDNKSNEPIFLLRFFYRSNDWLFIEKMTFVHGEFRTELELDHFKDMKRDVLSGGRIVEWFTVVEGEGRRIMEVVAANPQATSTIRLTGKDYYKDISLSSSEVLSFVSTKQLLTFAKQRQSDLKQKPN